MRAEFSPDASPSNTYYRVAKPPDTAQWQHDPCAVAEELGAAIGKLQTPRFHRGWVDINDPGEPGRIACAWNVHPSEGGDLARIAGCSVPAVNAIDRMHCLED